MENINCKGMPHIRVLADEDTDGTTYETLPARQIDEHVFELLASPGLALNLARGDIVNIADPLSPALVLKRGGNFCIQIYDADAVSQSAVDQLEYDVQKQLGGTMDGQYEGNLIFSVPGHHGIYNVNGPFDAFREATGVEWYFANIYANLDDDNDETLLNWWVDI
ncbi:DUF4265 domain-containing protein [Janthinobacterium sp. MP5059B]|uniref:DUF4265 domain-containing protein n=1 Tax=Janthinobacterium sp. MP5059B TaxID=1766683 RepID=UPI0009F2B78D|nr:DUF4265 domain-containing protein [Janthinobacterium sp. MP5059B]